MRSTWFVAISLCLIKCIYTGPIEVIYTGDGCECPYKMGYHVLEPQLPAPSKYVPNKYGYKIDVPPKPPSAKLYSFDFTVEEPSPKYSVPTKKLNLHAKVDRIAVHKPDCAHSYAKQSSPPEPPAYNSYN